jgi:hypothetical protein
VKIDAVFEGGGVKGIGFAGAISEIEKTGYSFENIAEIQKEIKTTDFDITKEESLLLYKNGEEMAKKFLETWDFKKWKEDYRN